jgi:hypothetical protein
MTLCSSLLNQLMRRHIPEDFTSSLLRKLQLSFSVVSLYVDEATP